ncbi:hypothetical protein N8094_00020 [Flavobacteriaceae bacterium]|jgi:hypothetical protein|nr:hypothetical protein [Flavobacteriaceae bacterium]
MENEMTKFRNLTISLKVAPDEKIMLKRMAEKYNVSLSELLYNLVMCFKGQYEYIGKLTPREEKLAENLRLEIKKKEKLKVQLENADYRVKIEQERALDAIKAKDDLTYQLKEEKAINLEKTEQIDGLKGQIKVFKQQIQTLKKDKTDYQIKNVAAGGFGVAAGLLLSR